MRVCLANFVESWEISP